MRHTTIRTALLLLLVLAASAAAQNVGIRLYGKVLDEDEQPIQGARITIETWYAKETHHVLKDETDKKGRYRLVMMHAARDLKFTVEAPGFKTFTDIFSTIGLARTDVNAPLKRDFVLERGSDPVRSGSPAVTPYNEGVAAFDSGDYAAAKSAFLKARELDPEFVPALIALSGAHFELGELEEAATAAEKAIELAPPGDTLSLRVLHNACVKLGRNQRAEEALETLVEVAPAQESQPLVVGYAQAAITAGDWPKAVRWLEKAVELDPGDQHTRKLLAGAREKQGQQDQLVSQQE